MFNEINPLKFWCHKILPLVYDDSLSYYELLNKVVAKLNEVIADIDNVPEYIKSLINDDRLKDIMSELLDELRENIAIANEGTSKTATAPRTVGDLVWVNGKLIRIIHNMIAGDQYFKGSNYEDITIEEILAELKEEISIEITNRENAIADEREAREEAINNEKVEREEAIEGIQELFTTELDVNDLKINGDLIYGVPTFNDRGDRYVTAIDENGVPYNVLVESNRHYVFEDEIATLVGNEVKFYFVESSNNIPNGTCVICVVNDEVYLFDGGTTNGGDNIIDWLVSHDYTKISGVVISHYHADHIGGLEKILNSSLLNFNGGTLYLPHGAIDVDEFVGASGAWVTERTARFSALGRNRGMSVVFPTENENFAITNSVSFTFNNLLTDYFEDYYGYTLDSTLTDTGYTTYNNFSMVCTVNNLHKKFVYTADIQDPATHNIAKIIEGADIVTAPHHGLNRLLDEDFVNNLTPSVYVVPTGENIWEETYLTHPDILRCLTSGAQVFITHEAVETEIEVNIDDINGTCTGKQYSAATAHGMFDYGMVLDEPFDFDDLIIPGVYEVKIASLMGLNNNAPFTFSGAKIIVEMISEERTLLQTCITNSSQVIGVYYRRYVGTSNKWTAWKALHASSFFYKNLVASDFANSNVTLTEVSGGGRNNYISVQNGFINLTLDFTANAKIPSGRGLFTFALGQYYNEGHGMLYGDDGNWYPLEIYCRNSNGNYTVAVRKDIPANVRVYSTGIFIPLLSSSST